MTNLDSNPLQTKSVDSDELAYIKHNRMLTEMIAKDHEIIQSLKLELFLERHRNDRRTDEAAERTTKEVP
jgi:hypothetical protein